MTQDACFRSATAEGTFNEQFLHEGATTWDEVARNLVERVCGDRLGRADRAQLTQFIIDMKFMPSEGMLRRAADPERISGDAVALRAGDGSREDWARLSWKAEAALLSGVGVGVDYSECKAGQGGGLLAKIQLVNDICRSTRSKTARSRRVLAALSWRHPEARALMSAKDWDGQVLGTTGLTVADLRAQVPGFAAPLDVTRTVVNFDTGWLVDFLQTGDPGEVFRDTVEQALRTGEPGIAFNTFDRERETLRGARGGMTARDDSDVCSGGSINLGRIESVAELADVTQLATQFLLCDTLRPYVPYGRIDEVRARTRRLGLGLMGVHEWLLRRGYGYEVPQELHRWLAVWRGVSDETAIWFADILDISRPVGRRVVTPVPGVAALAGTTPGIEPVFAVACRQRPRGGTFGSPVLDPIAQELSRVSEVPLDSIDCALSMAADPARRLLVQAAVQEYVDQAVATTICLPAWGSPGNDADSVGSIAAAVAAQAHRLRSVSLVPDGALGRALHEIADPADAVAAARLSMAA